MSDNELLDLGEAGKGITMPPSVGISAMALNFAMKFHDISTVQDGTLYQQYKLEGRNFRDLHLDMVFETARQIEKWMLSADNRFADMLLEGLEGEFEHKEKVAREVLAEMDADGGDPSDSGSEKPK